MVGLIAFTAAVTQPAKADSFKSSEFLTWKRETQAFYFRANVGMASLIAGQNDKAQGQCIDDWYYADETASEDYILDVMRKYPDYHPRGLILAAIQKKCGPLKYGHDK
ncbi:hypothetical protein [Kordiimonas sp.]|uniref:hypothetical protein n=1 Tax=Kordiimonas sp. TaxID=1970157 RepID=UPI003A9517FB